MGSVEAEWHAVFTEPTPLSAFAALEVPILCLTGSEFAGLVAGGGPAAGQKPCRA